MLTLPCTAMGCRKADIEAQIERAQKRARLEEESGEATGGSALQRSDEGGPVKMSILSAAPERALGKPPIAPKLTAAFADDGRWVAYAGSGFNI